MPLPAAADHHSKRENGRKADRLIFMFLIVCGCAGGPVVDIEIVTGTGAPFKLTVGELSVTTAPTNGWAVLDIVNVTGLAVFVAGVIRKEAVPVCPAVTASETCGVMLKSGMFTVIWFAEPCAAA